MNLKIYGYGAAAKTCTFIHYIEIQNKIQAIYDKNDYKQNKFIPNTKILIKSPNQIKKDKPDIIIVFIWNLKNEVLKELNFVKKWGGRILFLLPKFKLY